MIPTGRGRSRSLLSPATARAVATLLTLWAAAVAPPPALAASSYERAFAQLADLSPDPARAAPVRNLILRRDVATIELAEGTMSLFKPIEGRVWGAVFVGRGTFSFRPPTEIERRQLERFYKTDSLATSFESLVLLFADSTLVEIASQAKFGAGEIGKEGRKAVRRCLDLLLDPKSKDINYSIGKTCLEGASNSLFLAYFDPASHSKAGIFQIDPYHTEQVQLWRPVKALFFQERIRNREIICQFPLEPERESESSLAGDYLATYDDEHYRIESSFDGGLRLRAETEIRFRSLEDGQNWVVFALAPKLEVDSVEWEGGAPADFFKGKDALLLWVRCDRPLSQTEVRTLKIRYHGEVVDRADDWVYFDPSAHWYPRIVPGGRATFELTYSNPVEYTLVSVGEPVSSERRGSAVVSRWAVETPAQLCSFMMGIYKEHRIQSERIPPITVLMSESAHRRVRESAGESLIEQGLAPGRAMEKQVGADVANSLAFFQSQYGSTGLKRFYVAENPLKRSFLGLAYPGLIHLDWSTFYNTQSGGSDEMLRAHEVAHQWWGALGVVPATYHDLWLSEAFAEFSALWYLQAASKDSKRFLDTLKRSRERIVRNRKFLLGSGQEAGPIWLGPRTRTSTTQEDYRLIIYDKGAWVLHMLRNLFLDLETMKDGGFREMMREFYGTYGGHDATTADFQRMVEKHAGRDMSWFFREWIYGTDVPRYRFAWRVAPAEEGKFRVTCRVDQENVSGDFQMFIPVHVDFGGDRFAKVRVFVKGRQSEFELPLMPMEPKRIIFNDLESVLCEVENVDW